MTKVLKLDSNETDFAPEMMYTNVKKGTSLLSKFAFLTKMKSSPSP